VGIGVEIADLGLAADDRGMSDLGRRAAVRDGRLHRALGSLAGLSVADALGERFFGHPADVVPRIEARALPLGEWRWTDDTLMACSVVETLIAGHPLDRPRLFRSFVSRFEEGRGYGAAARDLLGDARRGLATMETASTLFGGAGSFGNGGAMRAGPLGAWYADEELTVVANAADASATVTHAHHEARAGTIAIAIAAALAWRTRATQVSAGEFLRAVVDATPRSLVRERVDRAIGIPTTVAPEQATRLLEVGMEASALDTVPFALWCAACSLDNYEAMFWRCVRGLGDRDTTCAMAGSIVASRLGEDGIPREWLQRREPLPDWLEQDADAARSDRPVADASGR
jgi:ADP-ribosylglycohydrolase